jgi:hypothetical protein
LYASTADLEGYLPDKLADRFHKIDHWRCPSFGDATEGGARNPCPWTGQRRMLSGTSGMLEDVFPVLRTGERCLLILDALRFASFSRSCMSNRICSADSAEMTQPCAKNVGIDWC